jgi:glycosyltransferase involved in cell wall biosynthesis
MKFSIITPSYNSEKFIEATIKSIHSQQGAEIEHIVMDGASKDGTVEILKRYPQIQWVSEKDKGQSDALNKGFARATGDIFAWQNADDLYLPGAFETVAKLFASRPEVDFVYGGYQIIDVDGKWICDVHGQDWNAWKFRHGRFVPVQPAVFWRRRVHEQAGPLNVALHYCMDVDFYSRASKTFRFHHIPELLGKQNPEFG